MDRAAATQALQTAYGYGNGHLVLRGPTGDITVPFSAFARRADVDALVVEALQAGRGADLPTRLVTQVSQALHGITLQTPAVLLDEGALAAAVTTAVAPLSVPPVDATITMSSTGPVTTPASNGQAVDPAPSDRGSPGGCPVPGAPDEVVVPFATTAVAPAVTDAASWPMRPRARTWPRAMWSSPSASRSGRSRPPRCARGWASPPRRTDRSSRRWTRRRSPSPLKAAAKAVAKPATSAIFLRTKSGAIFGVGASSDGRKLDTAATAQRIADELLARAGAAKAAAVKVALAPVQPKLTTEQAKKHAPVMTMLGTWTTWFPISDHNYFGANIWIPAQIINGTVLAPGHSFDWWSVVGDVSTARGFGPGGVIQGNHTDPTGALGGGMCSSSTTLFNAALRAGLQMGARGNHRYYINRYPLGLDATVWKMGGATQSMSFTNDTRHPILIVGIRTRGSRRPRLRDVPAVGPPGRAHGLALGAVGVRTSSRRRPASEYVSTLPHGVRNQTEYPSNQMDTAVTRVVRDASGHIIHSEVWQSRYVLWNGIIQVGR